MERSAFARAWDYLSYTPTAKWGAMLTAAGSASFYVVLLLVLALFADLIVSQGRIPMHADLNAVQRQRFRHDWNALLETDRRAALEALPTTFSDAELQRLSSLAKTDQLPDEPQAFRWKAYAGWIIQKHAGASAASHYRLHAIPSEYAPTTTDPEHVHLGVLSLVVRTRNHPVSHVVGMLAHWNAWMWQPTEGGLPNRPYLVGLLIMAVVVAVVRLVLTNAMHHFAARATLAAITRLRRLVYHHANRLGSLTLAEAGPSEPVSMFTRHIEAVHDGLYARLTLVIREPVKFLLLVALALSIHFWLGLAFLCAALLVWITGRQIATYFRRQGRFGARRAANQLALLQESVIMLRLVKGYLMELFNQARVERQLAEYSKAQMKRFRGEAIYRPLLIFFGTLAGAGLLFVAGWTVLTGGLNVADLVVMATALVSLYFPLDVWLAQRRLEPRAEDAAVALFEFLDRRGEVGQVAGAEFLKAMGKKLEFDGVALREPGTGRMLLDGLTLAVPAGKRVAIVGADEPEKHALVSLIPRFLDPTSGEIRIDGKNIRWVTLDSLRNQVALVSQQNLIFNDTVANNIGCGDPSYSIPQIIEAAKLAHVHNFVQRLPFGYETAIGELGHSLRVSEQFRIALARAILRDPAILIIEEPDRIPDENGRAMVDDAYARILPERTAIFLPHRLPTIKSCDRVFLIHNGKLEGEGEHRELLQENELYRHLHYLEYNIFAERV